VPDFLRPPHFNIQIQLLQQWQPKYGGLIQPH